MVAQARRALSMASGPAQPAAAARIRGATTETALVRWILIATGLLFIAVVLVLPLISVFMEALRNGVPAFFNAVANKDTWLAVRLTLLVAAIAVPLNMVFGL